MQPKRGAVIIAIILAILATIVFVLLPKSANLWVAYIVCLLGIVISLIPVLRVNSDDIPGSYALISQGNWFLLASLGLSIIVLILQQTRVFVVPAVYFSLAQFVLLAVGAIRVIGVLAGKTYISGIGNDANDCKKRIAKWVDAIADIENNKETDVNSKRTLRELGDAIRYSDPVSNSSVISFEKDIDERIMVLQTYASDPEKLKEMCNVIMQLVASRNRKLKASK